MNWLNQILCLAICIILFACSSAANKDTIAIQSTNVDDYFKDYQLVDKQFGTKTTVTLNQQFRVMATNALPNHSTGKFPNSGNPNSISAQKLTYKFPLNPTFSGESKWVREPGVAVNGVKFEPETAERFVCKTGEVYKIEAIQDLLDLGLDFNHAHVQPTGAYHYHGIPTELVKQLDKGDDIILIGFAKDGFPMYYSKSGAYKPSYALADDLRTGEVCNYRNPKQGIHKDFNATRPDGTFVSDWIYVDGLGQLDECNGIEINGQYGYFITKEYPYVSRCLKGEFTETRPKASPPGLHRHRPGRVHSD